MRSAQSHPKPLTPKTFREGLHFLAGRDKDLARILRELGNPPMWIRDPGFPSLVLIILEQQVSLASARAAYNRLLSVVSPLNPESFLNLNDADLKIIGFSRQKTGYVQHLAASILEGRLKLESLAKLNDVSARNELIQLKGIGPWTADIYLLTALRRPDIWPTGDLALAQAVQRVKGLTSCPTPDNLEDLATSWRPWRAIAARLFWHFYLNTPLTPR